MTEKVNNTNHMEQSHMCKGGGFNDIIAMNIKDALHLLGKNDEYTGATKKLQTALDLLMQVDEYAASHSTPLSSLSSEIAQNTFSLDFDKLRQDGKMTSSISSKWTISMTSCTGQVQLLQFLVRQLNAKNILEVGTYMGYAAFAMAEVMAIGGKVTGIDEESYFCDFVNKSASDKKLNIDVKKGAAITVLKSLATEGGRYDFIYIDCDKAEYCDYFKIIMDNNMLLPTGMMVCDNVIWSGTAITKSTDVGTAVDRFNKMVTRDERVTSTMLPCYDGLLLIQHK